MTRRWLAWFAVAVIVGMQVGTLFEPLGEVGETRLADWIDLLTPFAVIGCGTMVLLACGADRRLWVVFGVAVVIFTLGHGLHLSANSISNSDDVTLNDADIVHLWDEVVSHYIWYFGLFLMLVALALALRSQDLHLGVIGVLLASLFSMTLVNIYIEGDVAWLGVAFLATALVVGIMWRPAAVSRLLMFMGGLGLVLLVVWGISWFIADGRVFPEYSDVGWI